MQKNYRNTYLCGVESKSATMKMMKNTDTANFKDNSKDFQCCYALISGVGFDI